LSNPIRLTIFISTICLSSVGYAGESTSLVIPLLKGYEWQFDADKFKALPPDSYMELLRIARSEDNPNFIRERAMAALRVYPNDAVWSFFDEEVQNFADIVKRRRGVQAMCQTFAEERPGRVEDAIADLLESEDPHLRVTVARCFKTLNSESALQRLSNYRSKISESWEAKAVDSL